jgi:hypothetical protein
MRCWQIRYINQGCDNAAASVDKFQDCSRLVERVRLALGLLGVLGHTHFWETKLVITTFTHLQQGLLPAAGLLVL